VTTVSPGGAAVAAADPGAADAAADTGAADAAADPGAADAAAEGAADTGAADAGAVGLLGAGEAVEPAIAAAMGEAVAPKLAFESSDSSTDSTNSPFRKSSNSHFSMSGLSLLFLIKIFRLSRFGLGRAWPGTRGKSGRGSFSSKSPKMSSQYFAILSCCRREQWFSNDKITG